MRLISTMGRRGKRDYAERGITEMNFVSFKTRDLSQGRSKSTLL